MNAHDERRIPITPEPESESLLASFRTWIAINVLRRNRRDERQAKAAEAGRKARGESA